MRRNKLEVYVHFVWATWDRQLLITEDIERKLYRYISAVCENDKCEVLALGGMPDHVHLLVQLSNTVTLAQVMHDAKGGSSRFVSEELTGEWFAWQPNYGAFSVSRRDLKKVTEYIRNQKQRHADNDLWPDSEETFVLVDEPA